MATRKKSAAVDDLPCCANCTSGRFKPGADSGECWLLPMKWVYIGGGENVAKRDPAAPDELCRMYERKTH